MVGAWIEKEVEKEGIDTSLIFRVECLTGLSAIIVDEKSGERIIFSNQESAEKMEIHPEKIGDAEWISATDLSGDWKKSLGVIFSVADKNKIKVSFNPRGKNIQEDAKMVYDFCGKSEICFINKDEAIEILLKNSQGKISDENINDEIFLLKELKKSGVGLMVITDGERGAWVMKDEKIVYAKSLKEKAVDSTGTGDAFSSGFLAAYIKEKPLEECIRWGISNGGSVVNFYGAIDGLLNEEKIEEKAKSVETKEI